MKTNLPDSPEAEQAPREEILQLIAELKELFAKGEAATPGRIHPPIAAGVEESRRIADSLVRGEPVAMPPGYMLSPGQYVPSVVRKVDRLVWLLSPSDQERQFVHQAASAPSDEVNLQVFADWLEDERRPKEAETVRRITPEDGSLLVYRFPNDPGSREAVKKFAEAFEEQLDEIGRRVPFVCLPSDPALGWDITLLSPETGDVLVITYPIGSFHPDALAMRDDMQLQLKAAGRDVCVAALPEGYDARNHGTAGLEEMGLMPTSDHARFVRAVQDAGEGRATLRIGWTGEEEDALRAAAGLGSKRDIDRAMDECFLDPLKEAMGPQAKALSKTATLYNACALIDRQRKEIDALKAELAELLREKRERR